MLSTTSAPKFDLFDADTDENLGEATSEQVAAWFFSDNEGFILIDEDGLVLIPGTWAAQQHRHRTVYVALDRGDLSASQAAALTAAIDNGRRRLGRLDRSDQVTTAQVAALYGLDIQRVQRAARSGALAGTKLGTGSSPYIFTAAAAAAWAASIGATK
jgi:hypothetical protein